MMEAYTDFAKIYDALTFDVDYDAWAKRITSLLEENKPSIICELGCGTGSITCRLAKMGYSMIGIDLSEDMLGVAREKCEGENVLLLNQDMTDFELYGTVDAVICTLDSVNYLTEDGDLDAMLEKCRLYLNTGGLLIFDINTEHKIKNILAPNTFVYETDDVFYTWESSLEGNLCDYYLTFFVKSNDAYRRFDEVHTERIYTDDEIKSALLRHDFCLTGCYDGISEDAPNEKTERVMYVARLKQTGQQIKGGFL